MAHPCTADATRVMLVAKYPVLRHSLREIVEREADLAVVAEARDLDEAVIAARALQPDVVVLDASLARREGISALRRPRPDRDPVRVVCISISCDREHVLHALRAGACGFLRTEDAAEDLVPALRLACAERPFLGEAVDRDEIMSALHSQSSERLLVVGGSTESAAARMALHAAGYDVLLAQASRDGLELAMAARPDAIVFQLGALTVADLVRFIWELRNDADSGIRATPVLVVAPAGDGQDEASSGGKALWEPCDYLPVQGFLSSPLVPERLLGKVRALVRSRGPQ